MSKKGIHMFDDGKYTLEVDRVYPHRVGTIQRVNDASTVFVSSNRSPYYLSDR